MIVDDHKSPRLVPNFWYVHECANCGSKLHRHRQHKNAARYVRHGIDPIAFEVTWHSTNGSMRCGDAPYGAGHDRKWHDSDVRHTPKGPQS